MNGLSLHGGAQLAVDAVRGERGAPLLLRRGCGRSVSIPNCWTVAGWPSSRLGTPLGHAAYIAGALRRVREKHDELLGRIPTVPHLQSAWLLLLLCAQPRSNYLLRVLPPADTGEFVESHDKGGKRGSRAGRGNSHDGKDGLEEVARRAAAAAVAAFR